MNQQDDTEEIRSPKSFPFYRFKGSHYEIGRQHGEACRELIHLHLKLVKERTQKNKSIALTEILNEALAYETFIKQYTPFLVEEIQGIAEGANLSLEEVYLLQVRAEINRAFKSHNECTTFAIAPEATKNHSTLIGQNADLPEFYSSIAIVKEVVPEHGPATLMLTPAGQVSYIGINNRGLGVFANFLECEGWRRGYPRYMLSRLALTHNNVDESIATISNVHRASSRNLIMADKDGAIANMETTVTKNELLEPTKGILAHANHYLTANLKQFEKSTGPMLKNSQIRQQQMEQLLEENRGELSPEIMMDILRNRENYPNCLCQIPGDESLQAPGDNTGDIVTFASVIAEPGEGRIWVAMGPPNQYEYRKYSFSS